ncbi:chemotaxis protein CheB [Microbispora sp. NPDC049125]|uniref:chemotaxis protein CheB n=1 Tax=Microbispora sp. NPDC049125 TaxID=3154929 RepID=UPI0034672289
MGTIPGRDIVVAAASAGGVEALRALLAELPSDLEAAVLVVLHISPRSGSALAGILDRAGPLEAATAQDGEPLRHGRVYVAPPDHHLLIDGDKVRLSRGPRHNGHRPAADPLFLSAAASAGPRTVAVVLSGTLDDAARGCEAVRSRGGAVAVQDPRESAFNGMPTAAISAVPDAVVAPVKEIAALIVRQSRTEVGMAAASDGEIERELATFLPVSMPSVPAGHLTMISCPDCSGPLYRTRIGPTERYECVVGHAWSLESMIDGQGAAVERAFWVAILRLEERLRLLERMVATAEGHGQVSTVRRFRQQMDQDREAMETLRGLQARIGSAVETPFACPSGAGEDNVDA